MKKTLLTTFVATSLASLSTAYACPEDYGFNTPKSQSTFSRVFSATDGTPIKKGTTAAEAVAKERVERQTQLNRELAEAEEREAERRRLEHERTLTHLEAAKAAKQASRDQNAELSRQLEDLKAQKATLESQLSETNEQLHTVQSSLEETSQKLKEQLETQEFTKNAFEEQITKSQSLIDDLSTQLEKAKEQNSLSKEEQEKLTQQLEEATNNKARYAGMIAKSQKQISDLSVRVATLEGEKERLASLSGDLEAKYNNIVEKVNQLDIDTTPKKPSANAEDAHNAAPSNGSGRRRGMGTKQ